MEVKTSIDGVVRIGDAVRPAEQIARLQELAIKSGKTVVVTDRDLGDMEGYTRVGDVDKTIEELTAAVKEQHPKLNRAQRRKAKAMARKVAKRARKDG